MKMLIPFLIASLFVTVSSFNLVERITEHEPEQKLKLNLIPKHKKINTENTSSDDFSMPVMIQIEAPQVDNNDFQNKRDGIDFVLVIDDSGSMMGEKTKLVKKSIKFIVDELQSKDRLLMIKFNHSVSMIFNFMRMTHRNKKKAINRIQEELQATGSTNIKGSIDEAIDRIKNRHDDSRKIGFLFLSDGIDTQGNSVRSVVQSMQRLSDIADLEGLHVCSFGYGSNHDKKMLGAIPRPSEGMFYYVEKISDIEENMRDCLGDVLTFFANNIVVKFKAVPGFEVDVRKNYKNGVSYKHGLIIKKIRGISTEKKINILADLTNENEIHCNVGEKVLVMKGNIKYTRNEHRQTNRAKLYLKCSDEDPDELEFNVEIEEELEKDEAIKHLDKAREIYESTGSVQLASESMADYQSSLRSNNFLSDSMKKDIQGAMGPRGFTSDYEVNRSVIGGKAANTSFGSLRKRNSFQNALIGKAR